MNWPQWKKDVARTEIKKLIDAGRQIKPALRHYSRKTGIPYHTLHHWYYPRGRDKGRQLVEPEKKKISESDYKFNVSPGTLRELEITVFKQAILKKIHELFG